MGSESLPRPLSPALSPITGRGRQGAARRWTVGALVVTVAMSALVWACVAAACLLVGSTGDISWPHGTIFQIRREVVLLASLVGAALAGAGVAYQAILRNPLADPYLLGVSSGAMLFAYLWQ